MEHSVKDAVFKTDIATSLGMLAVARSCKRQGSPLVPLEEEWSCLDFGSVILILDFWPLEL